MSTHEEENIKSQRGLAGALTRVLNKIRVAIDEDDKDALTLLEESAFKTFSKLAAKTEELEEGNAFFQKYKLRYDRYKVRIGAFMRGDNVSFTSTSVMSCDDGEDTQSRDMDVLNYDLGTGSRELQEKENRLWRNQDQQKSENNQGYARRLTDNNQVYSFPSRVVSGTGVPITGMVGFNNEVNSPKVHPLCNENSYKRYVTDNNCLNPTVNTVAGENKCVHNICSCVNVSSGNKFNGNPLDYPRFFTRISYSVINKQFDEFQKMSLLLNHLTGRALSAVQSFEGVLGGFKLSLETLEERYGDPFVIVDAAIKSALEVKDIRQNDKEEYLDYSDRLCAVLQTLTTMDSVNEVTLDHLRSIVRKLPVADQIRWRDDVCSKRHKRPSFGQLVNFIKERARIINDKIFEVTFNERNFYKPSFENKKNVSHASETLSKTFEISCYFCNGEHVLSKCELFYKLSLKSKLEFVKEKRLCLNCFSRKHLEDNCTSTFRCNVDKCNEKHHRMLHQIKGSEIFASVNSNSSSDKSCLNIVPVYVVYKNKKQSIYALIDSGSDNTFIEQSVASNLGMTGNSLEISISTLNGSSTFPSKAVNFMLSPINVESNDYINVKEAIVVPELKISAEHLSRGFNYSSWDHLKDISSSNVIDNKVRLIIGTNLPEAFIQKEIRYSTPMEPLAIRGILGWSILGPCLPAPKPMNCNVISSSCSESDIDRAIFRIFDVESFGTSIDDPAASYNDRYALDILNEKSFIKEKRHYVPMLWKKEFLQLKSNRVVAEIRLSSLKNKLLKDASLFNKYDEIMRKYISDGYASKVTDKDLKKDVCWYLPHHPVIGVDKIRVVFDAACKYKGTSLNDCLLSGPDQVNSLVGVLIRFREHKIAVVGDIDAMFHQVRVIETDKPFLRFLWWDSSLNQPPADFQMNVHVFGAKSSPCCSSFALRKTCKDHLDIIKSFYVDDFLKSEKTEEKARAVIKNAVAILDTGGFTLRKWRSNSKMLLSELPLSERANKSLDLDFDKLSISKTLGIQWDPDRDIFFFTSGISNISFSKRAILSAIGSMFDPLGFLSPFLLVPKLIIQELWVRKIGWDDEIPSDLRSRWIKWVKGLNFLKKIEISRCVNVFSSSLNLELHVFSDASTYGYGTVAYLRDVSENSMDVRVSFLFGKSRVAPLKQLTIPRLELQAACLSVKIMAMLVEELSLKVSRIFLWTDSTTVLSYINNVDTRFHRFVSNRLAIIHEYTKAKQWCFCPGKENPADFASRGIGDGNSVDTELWLRGPHFLRLLSTNWPKSTKIIIPSNDVDVRKDQVRLVLNINEIKPFGLWRIVSYFSNLTRILKSIAWIVRFLKFRRSKTECTIGNLSVLELEYAEELAIKCVQKISFPDELASLKSGNNLVKKNSKLKSLKPILINGMICVGGRLENAPISYFRRHQILLPSKSAFTSVVIRHFHEKMMHVGVEATIAAIRERFWIIRCRERVKNLLRTCVICQRANKKPMNQVMSDLPSIRLIPFNPPFTRTGVDFFGPLLISQRRSKVKRYGCIFTCLNTRAIHIEISPSLSADDFINALKQFTNRRGCVEYMLSDNGTNFVGSEREIRESLVNINEKVANNLAKHGIQWKFQVPLASHMSGVWERMIRIIKRAMYSVVGVTNLDEHRLRTVLTEIEFTVNSRPLTPNSDDSSDLEALTPNHFLMQRRAYISTPGVFNESDLTCRRHWRQVQILSDMFWRRWINEYLPSLQKRVKWQQERKNVKEGDLVLLVEHNVPRHCYPLARVSKTILSEDGLIRAVEVKTSKTTLVRPITKLCQLELDL